MEGGREGLTNSLAERHRQLPQADGTALVCHGNHCRPASRLKWDQLGKPCSCCYGTRCMSLEGCLVGGWTSCPLVVGVHCTECETIEEERGGGEVRSYGLGRRKEELGAVSKATTATGECEEQRLWADTRARPKHSTHLSSPSAPRRVWERLQARVHRSREDGGGEKRRARPRRVRTRRRQPPRARQPLGDHAAAQ